MRSRPEAGSTDQDWGEKRAQNMVTVDNDGAKQAVLWTLVATYVGKCWKFLWFPSVNAF